MSSDDESQTSTSAALAPHLAGVRSARCCWRCGTDQQLIRVCKQCGIVRYCSLECARADAAGAHKHLCPLLADVNRAWNAVLGAQLPGDAAPKRFCKVTMLALRVLRQSAETAVVARLESKPQE